jgi:hypothetical protein
MSFISMKSKKPHVGEFNNGTGKEITVWVGAPNVASSLQSWGRLLVVEADSERAEEIRQGLKEQQEAEVYEEVLATECGEIVRWHRFNDVRLSGPIDLITWQQRFPNLRQTVEEQRCGRNLGELIDNWASQKGERIVAALHLKLRQGDPLAALVGLGSWIGQLEKVQLMLPWPEETMKVVEAWLTEQYFHQDTQSTDTWERDPLTRRDLLIKDKEKERQWLLAVNQQLSSDCEAMQTENKVLTENQEKLLRELGKNREAQDHIHESLRHAQSEIEKLRHQEESLRLECQEYKNEKTQLSQRLEAAETTNLNSLNSLQILFPMQLYKEENADLSGYEEEQLLVHYLEHGRHEGRLKNYQELNNAWKSSLEQCEKAHARLEQLEAQFELTQQQVETLKDLFSRLADKKQVTRKDKKE